jgi:hypothetical protein
MMSKWIAEFELEDGDTMPEHMDLNYKGIKIDFHCKPRPKGYWRMVDTNMYACSKCTHVLTIDPLDNSILEMNTCPFCSAKMEGVEE